MPSSRKASRRAATAGIFKSDDLRRQVGTFALLPQVGGAFNVPVIAAGESTDARGVAPR